MQRSGDVMIGMLRLVMRSPSTLLFGPWPGGGAMGSTARLLVGMIVTAMGVGIATGARAEARLWDGSLVVTSATPQCDAIGEDFPNVSLRALYRPRLKASDPKAAIIFHTDNLSHIIVIRATTNTSSLNGSGQYCGIDFDPGVGESSTWLGGNYNIAVVPSAVNVATPEVRVTGMVTKFGNIPGCNLRFRGAFLRRP